MLDSNAAGSNVMFHFIILTHCKKKSIFELKLFPIHCNIRLLVGHTVHN